MIVRLDHIGIVAPNIEQALGILDAKLGFPLASTTPLPDGAYFAPEGTHNYMFQVGTGETMIEVLVPVVPEAGTYKYLQRYGAGLHHWGYACDDVEEEAARLRELGLQQIELGGRIRSRLPQRFSIRRRRAESLPSWCLCVNRDIDQLNSGSPRGQLRRAQWQRRPIRPYGICAPRRG